MMFYSYYYIVSRYKVWPEIKKRPIAVIFINDLEKYELNKIRVRSEVKVIKLKVDYIEPTTKTLTTVDLDGDSQPEFFVKENKLYNDHDGEYQSKWQAGFYNKSQWFVSAGCLWTSFESIECY